MLQSKQGSASLQESCFVGKRFWICGFSAACGHRFFDAEGWHRAGCAAGRRAVWQTAGTLRPSDEMVLGEEYGAPPAMPGEDTRAGLERRAGHNIMPFLLEGCWVFTLFLCDYFISACS